MFKWLKRLFTPAPYPFELLSDEFMAQTWGGNLGSVVGGLFSGILGGLGAKSAADTQAQAANNATQAQQQMFEQQFNAQAPWRQAGSNALGQIAGMGDYFNHQFNANDLNANLGPNYQFMLNQGLTAATNAGNLYSPGGNTIQGATTFAENYAGNAYQQAYNNYTNNQTNIFNRLASIAGLGQTAASNSATGASQFAGGIANTMTGAGNALASGIVGGTNAITGGLNNGLSWYNLSNILGNNNGPGQQSYMPYIQPTDTSGWNVGGGST